MNIHSLSLPSLPGQPVDQWAQTLTASDAGQLPHVAQQFESLFVSMLLKELRQSADGDGLFAGDASDTYGALFDQFMGQHLAQQGAFGIANLVNQQLTEGPGA